MRQLFWSRPINLWFDLCEPLGGQDYSSVFSVLIELLSWCWWWVDMLLIVQWFHFYHIDNKPCVLLWEVCNPRLFSRKMPKQTLTKGRGSTCIHLCLEILRNTWRSLYSGDLKENSTLWMTRSGLTPNILILLLTWCNKIGIFGRQKNNWYLLNEPMKKRNYTNK